MTTDIEMTTEEMQPPIISTPKKPTGIGARLRAARETMHLSEKDAAARLHLAPRFIGVMENEDFESGLPATFMRGYIRSYGRLLNIPLSEVDAAILQLGIHIAPTVAPPATRLHTPLSNNNERYVQWLTYLIVVVLIVLVCVWWRSRPLNTNTPTKANAAAIATIATPSATPLAPAATSLPAPAATTTPAPPILPYNTPISAQPPVNSAAKSTTSVTSASTNETATATAPLQPKPDKNVETHKKMALPEPDLNTIDY